MARGRPPRSPRPLGRHQPADLGPPGRVEAPRPPTGPPGSRSQSATGASASRPDVAEALAARHHARPAAGPASATSATRRVLPDARRRRGRATRPGRPAAAARHSVRQQAELRLTGRRAAPRPTRRGRRRAGRPPGGRAAGPRAGHQALERLRVAASGHDAQLALQHRRAVVVGADRAGPVAQVGLQLHQRAVADLLQRLQLDPAARGIHRPGQVAGRAPGSRRAGRTGPRTAARAPTGPRAASRRTRRAAGRPGTRRRRRRAWPRTASSSPAAAAASAASRSTSKTRRSTRQVVGVAPAQVAGRDDQRAARRPAPGAAGAARGAGWSAPARRSESGQNSPAIRCRGCGDPACTARNATRATARDERA